MYKHITESKGTFPSYIITITSLPFGFQSSVPSYEEFLQRKSIYTMQLIPLKTNFDPD